ncbi:MAG TPA: hypothetical protein VNA57_03890 [Acidimicrobiales bacterium]|nr:hypothetical protein [Acidimicrobiales bacterium]
MSVSNVDKKSAEGEVAVRLVNYTDVYYGDRLSPAMDLMEATATLGQVKAFRVRPGDVVITKDSETADDIGIPAFVESSSGDMVLGYHLALLRPRDGAITGRYLYWAMSSDDARGQLSTGATGVTRFGLRRDVITSTVLSVPSAREQCVIAEFLDTETARIDALITKKRRMIDLLRERFWTGVVSAIERAQAEIVPLRRALRYITDGPFGSSLTSSHYSTDGARVVRLGNIGFAEFKDDDRAFISLDHFNQLSRHRVLAGHLLIAGLGDANNHVGRACVAPDLGPALVKADCYCAEVEGARGDADFLALFLSSPAGATHVALAARGTTRSRINLDIAKAISVPLPAVAVQTRIVSEAKKLRATAAETMDKLSLQITLLQEHRQAMITAAVTGELAIPGVAA